MPDKKSAARKKAKELSLGTAGLELIKEFEGLELEAYQDKVGVWTIGYGHTANVKEGDKITAEEAEKLLKKDLASTEADIKRLVKVPLRQQEYDSLASFIFNVGGTNFKSSTLLKRLNSKDYDGAMKQFARWDKAGGKPLAGLTRRRKREAELFKKFMEQENLPDGRD